MAHIDAKHLAELQRAFKARLSCEVAFDPYRRALYSTDASNHQVEPLGVVIPQYEEDLFAIIELANELNVSVLPRGGGTSLAGQAVGSAVIVDCSKHLDDLYHLDVENRLAEVGPGMVCARLNQAARRHGLMYGPDPASANRATFGGMIGNNATGAHSIRYGMTADHVRSLQVVLSDGTPATFGPMSPSEAAAKAEAGGAEGRIYAVAQRVRQDYEQAIRTHWPRTWRRASGYSLNYLTGFTPSEPPAWYAEPEPYPPRPGFNLAPVMCGSEGTLAVIRRAVVSLVELPKHTLLLAIPFEGVAQASEMTPALLETEPAAIELLPRALLERAARVPAYARKLTFSDEIPEALLVVEYAGSDRPSLFARAQQYAHRGTLLETPSAQEDLWEIRKAGLGLLMSVPGDTKPITFIEDVAVPVEQLGRYVREVERILEAHGTTAEWYAHASAGCLHLRPMVNLKTAEGVEQMRRIAEAVADLVIGMRGALSGEHGDGLSHTEFNARLFGPELTQAFRDLKRAFDPKGLLNPGKVVLMDGDSQPALDGQLRYGPGYRTVQPGRLHFAHRREGSLAGAVEACTGLGVCRKDDGVMCPSYQATRDERHLTRGRANALRAAISGWLPPGALTSEHLYEVFDLCLECKGCKAECPTAVDIARVKAEFLALYQAEHGVPLRSRLFGEVRAASAWAQPFAPLVNRLAGSRPARWLQEKLIGISRHRRLPAFAGRRFSRQFKPTSDPSEATEVMLFLDTYTEMNTPHIGWAAVKVLEAAGYTVNLARQQGCCGRPMISKGLLDRARRCAERNLQALGDPAERGMPIIGLEPSCLLTLRDEYLEFFPEDPRAHAVAEAAVLLEEFLVSPDSTGARPIDRLALNGSGPVLVHTHCHAKSLVGSQATLTMLEGAGYAATEIDSGCCGMAGSFGYEHEHYQVSMQVGELKLFPALRGRDMGARVAAHGVSCRTQIHDGTGVEATHPVELIADALIGA